MEKSIKFTKMHGCGNDYIYVDDTIYSIAKPSELARRWSDRHCGIGGDGLVLIGKSPVPEADFTMRIFNADGSEAMMCGNASRCIGKYVYDKGLTRKTEVRLLTLSGIKILALHIGADGFVATVTVDMGRPADIHPMTVGGYRGTFVSMGNPHFVVFTDDIAAIDLEAIGPVLEHDSQFADRANIEFAQILPSGSFRTRVWERGSGITMACGTGACATAVAAAVAGRAGRVADIVMDGGTLNIEWADDDHIYKTGPAVIAFEGEIAMPPEMS